MITTESTLWDDIKPVGEAMGVHMTRMEVSTALGVGDVEYVGKRCHGWIELKIAGRKLTARTQSEYTLAQAQWLLAHHKPQYFLRSWLLCAHRGPQGWEHFTLATPQASLALLSARVPLTWLDFHAKAGVYLHYSLDGILRIINT